MKIIQILITAVLAVALLGCGKQQPRHIVILQDVSASIDRDALKKAFTLIDELAGHLHRGDRMVVIPIRSDAQTEAPGHILRFEMPTRRKAYDADLKNLRLKLRESLAELSSDAMAHPGRKTDILGSVTLAEHEFHSSSGTRDQLLIILSDFIEDDGQLNFSTDIHLNDQTQAARFAEQVARKSSFDFRATTVYLGLLLGNDYARLPRYRRAALKRFWTSYFESMGADTDFALDGTALLIQQK